MGLIAETMRGDLDLSFGSVIRYIASYGVELRPTHMVVSIEDRTLAVNTIALAPIPVTGRAAQIQWSEIDQYEQVVE